MKNMIYTQLFVIQPVCELDLYFIDAYNAWHECYYLRMGNKSKQKLRITTLATTRQICIVV